MKKLLVALTLTLLLTSCSSSGGVTNLGVEEFLGKTQEPNVLIIDVRTAGEFAQGHLQNAINIDVEGGMFDEGIAKLDKSASYAVYCRSGRRSTIAAGKMSDAGFSSIFNLKNGGFAELAQVGALTS